MTHLRAYLHFRRDVLSRVDAPFDVAIVRTTFLVLSRTLTIDYATDLGQFRTVMTILGVHLMPLTLSVRRAIISFRGESPLGTLNSSRSISFLALVILNNYEVVEKPLKLSLI